MKGLYPIPSLEPLDPAPGADVDASAVTAILVTEDGRFLLQLRDDIPGILLPGHWACFGGHLDSSDEAPEAALRRELQEELAYDPAQVHWLTECISAMPRPTRRRVHYRWFVVPLPLADLPKLVLNEGAGMRLFTLDELLALPKVSPVDVMAILMYARNGTLFPA